MAGGRWYALIGGLLVLFGASVLGGYWVAARLDLREGNTLARETLDDMKRSAPASSDSAPRYARIEDLPGLPKYTEAEPDEARTALEDKPRAAKPQQLAAAASSADTTNLPTSNPQTWRRNALPFADLNSKPLVAIVIDDVGLDRPRSKRAWELPGPLTMSFLPYAKDLGEQARAARAHNKELMLHVPMEPNGRQDPGPGALLVSLPDAELRLRTQVALDSFDGYAGVNNHMGSRFTAFRPGMDTVLRQLKARGLMFLDSRTTSQSVGDQLAQEMGVPSIVRHVFLDDDESIDAVHRKLAEAEALARRQGFVIAIGHPHEATLQALSEWLPTVQGKGLALAPATAAMRKRNGWN
ncbi:MAG: divergent polysaccharide deacetylase family protein [Alphaproteobacteria bacterium]|nr:divergent polysaccharide deacetylase family protein [Alphaproteobacteria bacterium]MBV8412686.1 divergent polysaccharide deacetylase family protein [Alphaproteobacteria bacterium]